MYGVNLDEARFPLDSYPSFGDFFCRTLKDGIRPIQNANPDALVGPGPMCIVILEAGATYRIKARLASHTYEPSSVCHAGEPL